MKRFLSLTLAFLLLTASFNVFAKDISTELEKTINYYEENFDELYYEGALAMALAGNKTDDSLFAELDAITADSTVGDIAKNILAAKATDKTLSELFGSDIAALLTTMQQEDGSFGWGMFDTYIAMLALDSTDTAYNKAKAVESILAEQDASGAFGYFDWEEPFDFIADIDTTAMMVFALSSYKSTQTDAAVKKAIDYIMSEQDTITGGFISIWTGADNVSTAAYAILSLISAGEDINDAKYASLIANLLSFQNTDGSFTKDKENEKDEFDAFSTAQALLALVSIDAKMTPYQQLNKEKSFVFSTDIADDEDDVDDAEEIVTVEVTTTANNTTMNTSESPETGDSMNTFLLMTLLLLSASIILKKQWQK